MKQTNLTHSSSPHSDPGSAETAPHGPLGKQHPQRLFAPFEKKMRQAGLPDAMIRSFRHYYMQLVQGATGYISSVDAQPVENLPQIAHLNGYTRLGLEHLDRLVMIKLNGGLGTSMGLTEPKSLLPVKNGLSFLDITVHQVLTLREKTGVRLPLLLMDSFNTREASLAALARYPALAQDLPLDFLQHKEPKIWQSDLSPVSWPEDPSKEWCPPGHGDIYLALMTSGLLEQMLEAGYEYAFVSNIDNLGATVDVSILGYVVSQDLPFLMEATHRTEMDRKGGHLAQDASGRLLLRESAQCPPDEMAAFQDISLYRYFNTNNLWIHLPSLQRVLERHGGLLPLPMIRNVKPVDPSRPDTPKVYQLETAMGLALSVFEGAQAICVERNRFRPVKRCNDLLALWSDAYVLTEDYHVLLNPERTVDADRPAWERDPIVTLDDRYYSLLQQLKERFPHGAPSLIECRRLRVQGDVYFGANVKVRGEAELVCEEGEVCSVPDGAVIG